MAFMFWASTFKRQLFRDMGEARELACAMYGSLAEQGGGGRAREPIHKPENIPSTRDERAQSRAPILPLPDHYQAPIGHYQATTNLPLATTKPPLATPKPLPSRLSPLQNHYQSPFGHYQATTNPPLATTKPRPSPLWPRPRHYQSPC